MKNGSIYVKDRKYMVCYNAKNKNIITELEEWLEEKRKESCKLYKSSEDEDEKDSALQSYFVYGDILKKIKELTEK